MAGIASLEAAGAQLPLPLPGDEPPLPAPPQPRLLVRDTFAGPPGEGGLITNSFAFFSDDPTAVRSPIWEVTSGSLFARGGRGWSGPVDAVEPDRLSSAGTGSYVFRARTVRADLGSVRQMVSARIIRFYRGTRARPANSADGVVLWPRYRTERRLYFAYVLRNDGRIALTKKCPGRLRGGGFYNGGTYFSLARERRYRRTAPRRWYRLGTEVVDRRDGSVTVRVIRDGAVVLEAHDRGVGCRPIKGPARAGVRADNAEFELDNYRVDALG